MLWRQETARAGKVRVLGGGEFAPLRGQTCATLFVDLEARQPIDVMPGREAAPVASWLADHPEVEVIWQDRGSTYAEAARAAAPQAVQVADAWRLRNNLGRAVEKTVTGHYKCVRSAFADTGRPLRKRTHLWSRMEPRTSTAVRATSSPVSANGTKPCTNSSSRDSRCVESAGICSSTTTRSDAMPELQISTIYRSRSPPSDAAGRLQAVHLQEVRWGLSQLPPARSSVKSATRAFEATSVNLFHPE
ncbi:transposase [Streptomyces sp. NPDC053726]|uniref:transposase n=1 Tax=Streptomyces sp. NPDC053726 TaxID=3365713 RepID=UPI0037D2B650